ncbi:SDR family NAD(P)-dependent oxidoreductase [Streptomyces sp. NPDC087844]|uniref:SDR family NAD(P)-dependent oxidoreductase n=1 Tax=Streptomyces sp. NPDC087844 TaxID=3365805 RepID=UPI00381200CF
MTRQIGRVVGDRDAYLVVAALKRVLVTGGTHGLGEQIVRLLAAEGARVATCARTAGGLLSLRGSLAPQGSGQLFTQALDVTEPERLESFVAASAKRFDGLDGVVASVGGSCRRVTDALSWVDSVPCRRPSSSTRRASEAYEQPASLMAVAGALSAAAGTLPGFLGCPSLTVAIQVSPHAAAGSPTPPGAPSARRPSAVVRRSRRTVRHVTRSL